MRIFVIFVISTHFVAGLPIDYDQIIFPDDKRLNIIAGKTEALKFDKTSLIDDPNLLKSENTTEEFFNAKEADSKFEHGNHFQGDIVLLEEQRKFLNSSEIAKDDLGARTGLIWEGYRWPKNKYGRVVVPYEISNVFCKYYVLLS